jgi:short-subunit dehydrogenase
LEASKPDGNKTGQWALVTGASAGIGAEYCRQLAALGYHVVLVARREDKMTELAGQLEREYQIKTRVLTADLASVDAGRHIAQTLSEENIEIEYLVNNAGYGLPGHFTTPSWQQHQDFIQVMMTAVCDLTFRLLPSMQRNGKGYIVNVASLAGMIPSAAGHTLYGASKAFLIRFSESLSMENAERGVRVSALCPGFTYTEFHDVTGTRELVSKMPSWMWKSAQEVVSFGIDAVDREQSLVVAIPGRANRFIALMMRCLPAGIARWLIRRMAGNFRHQKKQSS